ncbi:MAG: hypothetical protein Fur0043_15050 [Anaerolineales bacterium]
MATPFTIGLARMHVEFGERRDFLPSFVARLVRRGAQVVLEQGYGSGMGLTQEDYLVPAPELRFVTHEEIFNQDVILVLRCPTEDELKHIKKGATDPYTLDANPTVVRGVEGIPQGNLDQYIFPADDPKWDNMVPQSIPSKHRRTTVTCYSWPGVHPEACMTHYAQQLEPFIEVLFEKGYDGLSLDGTYFERALYRATLKAWLESANSSDHEE